ncbi:NrtA/SsuA/CpmA family ABC transporter substrate-binding protein [Ancylobacter sp. A5.8]|uniref:ABC transporter substrate-binding protein n=1 Tax=Ancylobacter gelatini TaxID=2919920 RepID=UPI001F4E6A17|nr:NrtA/SsuA/CpmA family ABC transporter substrate-binding protein [Ancylobacter gelatini]MCJ8142618.1 NrtA/SsuA/CpmA family ABC transporter substrate-binding protein [Ancylobacter gelatini]
MTADIVSHALSRRSLLQLGAAGALASTFPFGAAKATETEATLAYGSTGYTWALTFVAEALGTWKQNGVNLNVVDFPTGRESMQALLAGSADFSTSTDTPFIFAALRGLKPIVLVNYSRYSRDMKIVVSKASGIDPASPASLKGKKIATRVGTSGQYMLAKYLEMAGLGLKDVTVVDLSPNDMTVATLRGDVDGFAWTGQAAVVAEKQSNGAVAVMTQEGLDKYFQSHQLLLTSEKVIKEKPALLDAAVKSLLGAEERIAADPTWTSLIAERVRAPAQEITEATSVFEFKIGFDERFLDDLVAQAEWAIATGLAQRPEGDLRALLRGLIYEGPVKAVKPERVTI